MIVQYGSAFVIQTFKCHAIVLHHNCRNETTLSVDGFSLEGSLELRVYSTVIERTTKITIISNRLHDDACVIKMHSRPGYVTSMRRFQKILILR
jgi:hypothetical protein